MEYTLKNLNQLLDHQFSHCRDEPRRTKVYGGGKKARVQFLWVRDRRDAAVAAGWLWSFKDQLPKYVADYGLSWSPRGIDLVFLLDISGKTPPKVGREVCVYRELDAFHRMPVVVEDRPALRDWVCRLLGLRSDDHIIQHYDIQAGSENPRDYSITFRVVPEAVLCHSDWSRLVSTRTQNLYVTRADRCLQYTLHYTPGETKKKRPRED